MYPLTVKSNLRYGFDLLDLLDILQSSIQVGCVKYVL